MFSRTCPVCSLDQWDEDCNCGKIGDCCEFELIEKIHFSVFLNREIHDKYVWSGDCEFVAKSNSNYLDRVKKAKNPQPKYIEVIKDIIKRVKAEGCKFETMSWEFTEGRVKVYFDPEKKTYISRSANGVMMMDIDDRGNCTWDDTIPLYRQKDQLVGHLVEHFKLDHQGDRKFSNHLGEKIVESIINI